jgi:hypothetical protein
VRPVKSDGVRYGQSQLSPGWTPGGDLGDTFPDRAGSFVGG